MPSFKTYKGARLDLETYQGKATIDYEIEVINDDESDFDLTVYSAITWKVYYRQHGELILTLTPNQSSNVLLFRILQAQTTALQLREYFYECYGVLVTPTGEQELICYGTQKNI